MLKSEGWGEADEGVHPRRGARLFISFHLGLVQVTFDKFLDATYDLSTNNPAMVNPISAVSQMSHLTI